MDQQLANLLVAFWTTGDPDAAKVLADRLAELDSESVAQALVEFRQLVKVAPALHEAGRLACEAALTAIRSFSRAVGPLRRDRENFRP